MGMGRWGWGGSGEEVSGEVADFPPMALWFKRLSLQGKPSKPTRLVLASLSGTLKLFYTTPGLEKSIKSNVNVTYSLTHRCKAAQLYRGFRSLE